MGVDYHVLIDWFVVLVTWGVTLILYELDIHFKLKLWINDSKLYKGSVQLSYSIILHFDLDVSVQNMDLLPYNGYFIYFQPMPSGRGSGNKSHNNHN